MKTQDFEEKLRILSLSNDSRKIIQTLSNETSIRVLQLLETGDMSASELAGGLDLRLNTLQYHLDALLEADLIRISEVKWSQRGRKIKVYEPVEKLIILIPGRNTVTRTALSGLLQECMEDDPDLYPV
ncbi:helix-turn-helix transcriptional regulator [Methanosarcina sp. KYL-1]|uniref:ArsR/SmtB family transcription factor n=1 Tax=Methanosarcina sp. KYL-1 TaxID=2602068 RepID=UPI002100BF1E|nr:helix-turn-helix domain-containing protein [Methanosarcina sp. KYL-1]MCQ1535063.1 helix-turn-helix transcriptional regulator [Methanosarcina sp. KYL-1]